MRLQTGEKQLYVENTDEGLTYYSYNILVAKIRGGVLYITPTKYSVTTSKHCTLIKRCHSDLPCREL